MIIFCNTLNQDVPEKILLSNNEVNANVEQCPSDRVAFLHKVAMNQSLNAEATNKYDSQKEI